MKKTKLYFLTFLLFAGFALFAHQSHAQKEKPSWKPEIPKNEFGLELSAEDKRALITFLKTL